MGSLILKLAYILIGLSIAEDFLHFGGFRFNAEQYGTEISAQSSGLFFPGANGVALWPIIRRPIRPVDMYEAIRKAKNKVKNSDSKEGEAKNEDNRSKGDAGM